jgi:SET domain-containing protein
MTTYRTKVDTSSIHGAGQGLFAVDAIPKNAIIMQYTGDVVPVGADPTDGAYSYYIGNVIILGTNDARFINDNVDFRKFTRAETIEFFHQRKLPRISKPHNVAFVERVTEKCVDVVALQDIQPGEELLSDYGFSFWVPRAIRAGLTDHTYNVGSIRL